MMLLFMKMYLLRIAFHYREFLKLPIFLVTKVRKFYETETDRGYIISDRSF